MTWEIALLSRSLGDFLTHWDALNQRYYGGHPYMDSRFVEALLNAFATGNEYLCVHRSDDAIDAMIILVRVGPGIWRQFSPAQSQVSPTLLPKIELLANLYSRLPGGAFMIELMNEDPNFSPAEFFAASPLRRVTPSALTMSIALRDDFQTYWNARPRKLVQNLRRYRRRAEQSLGAGTLRVITHPDDMPEAIARFGQLESEGWKGRLGTAVHAENQQGWFYTQVMRSFCQHGDAEVVEYWLNSRLAASRLVIRNASITIMLKTAYDEALSSIAPGRLLLEAFLEREFGRGTQQSVEFYTNATADQLSWATDQRTISHITCFRSAWLARLYDLLQGFKARRQKSTTPTASSRDAKDIDKPIRVQHDVSDANPRPGIVPADDPATRARRVAAIPARWVPRKIKFGFYERLASAASDPNGKTGSFYIGSPDTGGHPTMRVA